MEIRVTPIGIEFGNITFKDWLQKGEELKTVIRVYNENVRFWLGDWINCGETRFGEKYSQALETEMYSIGTLRNCSYVCRNVPIHNRINSLSFDHHAAVAKLNEDQQVSWLKEAETNGWTVRQLRRALDGKVQEAEKVVPDKMEPIPNADFDLWWDMNKRLVSMCAQDYDKCKLSWRGAKGVQ